MSDGPPTSANRAVFISYAREDIPLLDHVIIGRMGADPLGRGYYSFRGAGLL